VPAEHMFHRNTAKLWRSERCVPPQHDAGWHGVRCKSPPPCVSSGSIRAQTSASRRVPQHRRPVPWCTGFDWSANGARAP